MRRILRAIVLGATASLLLASTAFASHCVNASKPPAAGAQVLIDFVAGEITWANGVTTRIEQGLIDPETGEGYRGQIAFDLDGDGNADVSTWVGVGPEGHALPGQAMVNGPACQGVTDIETFLAECLGT